MSSLLKTRKSADNSPTINTELDLVKESLFASYAVRFDAGIASEDISIKFIQCARACKKKLGLVYKVCVELAERVHPDRRSFPLT